MKKFILAVAAVGMLAFSAYAQNDDDKKAEQKKELSAAFQEQFTQMGVPEEQATPLADCLAGKMVDNLSEEEMEEMMKMDPSSPGSEELQGKIQEWAMDCMQGN